MEDNLLDAAIQGGGGAKPRPGDVPEKFWDAERGELRVDALLKSYRELERRLSQRLAPPGPDADEEERRRWREIHDIPDSPEDYQIEVRHALTSPDLEVNRRLYEAGFSRQQVQLVYDLAAERLLPLIAEAAQQFEADRQMEKLRARYGGEERFRRLAQQLSAWGRANLPPPVFEALSTTEEGVVALERMMRGKEPELTREAAPPPAEDEGELRKLMRDPRYWRSREPELVRRVTEGFRRLAGG
ncbi:capsid assembly protein [Rubritepida flocculans]|jgi:hypothetical protein|uniref:capsid assembly protein n=1 Tax=Rubritepida flocculans TaxID=182403 RepID=UPI0003FA8388|nr:hypothetical protein [Rubritepida flocculans]